MPGGTSADTPVAIIEKGTTPQQRTVSGTLSNIAKKAGEQNVSPPALLVIGKTVELRDKLKWFRSRELSGMSIVVTRPFSQSKGFSEKLAGYGARIVSAPAIRTVYVEKSPEIDTAIENIGKYDLIVFSSANGIGSFFHALKSNGKDVRSLFRAKIAVIGPATGEAINDYGITPDIIAEKFIAESLFQSIKNSLDLKDKKILIAGSDIGRKTLEDGLKGENALTEKVVFYKTEPQEISDYVKSHIRKGKADIITFTSSSTVKSFFSQIKPEEIPSNTKYASIGPETSATIEKYGITAEIEASEYTTEGLIEAIVSRFGKVNNDSDYR